MIKQALSYLIIVGGCSGVAILSISFSNNDNKRAVLWNKLANTAPKITTIKSYGDIDAYGLQNGCTFRILHEDKHYSLADFYTEKITKNPALEKGAIQIAQKNKAYCGKDMPIVTFSYKREELLGKLKFGVVDIFKIEKTPIKN